jgi:glutathione synthase/RimK-type ligase-like ATP-grasp enzyme
VAASERAVLGLIDSLPAFQLDPGARQQRADGKPLQLALARRLGLDIPDTLITNDPDAVRAFAARVGPVIAKMLVQPAPTGPATGGEAEVVFTTALDGDALAELDGLELCPMIFQARLANARDVRVAIAGRRVFAGALEAGGRGGEVDWRRHSHAHDQAPPWAPYELPGELAARLVGLADRLGVEYAAIDLIVEPDGRHVFLELNATGAFAFLGDDLARPIAAAIADVLVDPAARRGVHDG